MATIIVASDAPSVRAEVAATAGSPDITIVEARSGPEVMMLVADEEPDLVVVDLQMGNMGGMATCLELRLEASYDKIGHVPVLMLLDRRPDVFLARRSGAEGWLVKPLDPIRLRRAVAALLALRLGLSQFPRGQGFRDGAGRIVRRGCRRVGVER